MATLRADAPATSDVERLKWLDIVRSCSALTILTLHWLRACLKVGLFKGPAADNLAWNYMSQTAGLFVLPHVLIAGMGFSPSIWLTNIIGFLGEFGWEGVNVLIIVSGFSLTIALGRRGTTSGWLNWILKRASRVLTPFYIVAVPLLGLYFAVLLLLRQSHSMAAAALLTKMDTQLQTPPLGIVLSHLLLFDPFAPQWQAVFLAPAWWFVPAILLAYAIYPALAYASKTLGGIPLLLVAAVISVCSYHLVSKHILVNFSWYFIILQELFNLSLGIVAGKRWQELQSRTVIYSFITSKWAPLVGATLFTLGNLANWCDSTRIFASMIYAPGLTLILSYLGKSLEDTLIGRALTSIDSYDLYLVHQPFAFPVALLSKFASYPYAVFGGWFIFLIISSLAAMLVGRIRGLVTRHFSTDTLLNFNSSSPVKL